MYKLKKVIPFIMFLSFIMKANECYGMKINENNVKKTGMEKIKALPHSTKIFIYGNKFFFSLAHSIINNFYKLETLEMNKLYFLKKYLCWGYRLQPSFMSPYSFIDFNVNVLGGVMDTAIFLYLSSPRKIKITSKIFYVITSFLNININIKSNFYISINILGLIRAVIIPFLIKGDENDNNLDNIDNNNQENNNNLDNIEGNNNQKNNNNLDNIGDNNNQENNNDEDEWEKIRKRKGITDKQNQKIEEKYTKLNDRFFLSDIQNFDEIKFKEKILEFNFNDEKIEKYIADKIV